MIVIKTSSKWALSFLSDRDGQRLEKNLIIGEANCDDLAEKDVVGTVRCLGCSCTSL